MKDNYRYPIPKEWVSSEIEMLTNSVARWAEQEVISLRTQHREDYTALIQPALNSLMNTIGIVDLLWSSDEDTQDLSAITLAAVLEQVAVADMGMGMLLANTAALQRFVSPALKPVLSKKGEISSLVLPGFGGQPNTSGNSTNIEPSTGLYGLTAQVQAKPQKDGWLLSGNAVRPQCHGAESACFGIVVELEGLPALFAVSANAAGLTRGEPIVKTGLFSSRNADLELRSVTVDKDWLLWKGVDRYRELLAWYYLGCAATVSGGMLALHRILDDWCEWRVIKGRGQAFKANPLVASLLGEIGGQIATNRILVYHLAHLLDQSHTCSEANFATAVAITRSVLRAAMDGLDRGMELMASAGYATEWNLERYWRDTRTLSTYLMLETVGQGNLARHYFGCRNLQ